MSLHLAYAPYAKASVPIVRTPEAVVRIECHYSRMNNVSSSALSPVWIPYIIEKEAEESLVFSLILLTDDLKFERPSKTYFLGDFINIEASVKQYKHAPLRVFVDGCVATTVPDISARPRYTFLDNHGCLVDANITGSSSRFLSRVQDNKLTFMLESFRFDQAGQVYITCFLKVTAASDSTSAENKACSYLGNGWASADGNDDVCSCCETHCGLQNKRDLTSVADNKYKVNLGPISIEDNPDYGYNL